MASNLNIRPVFTIDLNQTILIGKVTVGKYDGTHPCLTAVTTSDKVLIHSPHRRSTLATGRISWSNANKEIAYLNMSQSITAILAAKIVPNDERDMLVIGSPSHILVYNVHDNKDVFYKECTNGVTALTVGSWGDAKILLFVGGNCSIHGYNHLGDEVFWTVIGDNVTDMILYNFNQDGENKLIVGCEDSTIRVFKNTNVIVELHETEVVNILAVLPEHKFGYGVANGTIGVYEQDIRLWRVKSKNNAIATRSFDLLGHGNEQLVTGWSNGKIDVRAISTGEVLYKEHLNKSIAGLIEADYRGVGKCDLIAVTVEGEVRGYATSPTMIVTNSNHTSENEIIRELFTRKQTLLLELRHYEGNQKFNAETAGIDVNSVVQDNVGVIPANTRLQIGISTELTRHGTNLAHVDISISTNNTTIIKAVMIFAEGIFEGETLVFHPKESQLSNMIRVPIHPPKDVPVDIHIKAFVGYPGSIQFHVFELTRQLPKFSMYALLTDEMLNSKHFEYLPILPDSYVEFKINERLPRICIWINQNFLLPIDIEPDMGLHPEKSPDFILNMVALRNKGPLQFKMDIAGNVRITTENMLLAADLIQSLAIFLNLEQLQVKAHFSKDERMLCGLLEKLNQLQDVKTRLGTDIADKLGQIREIIMKAEDSRINNLDETQKFYNQLKNLNDELISGYNIRLANYNESQDAIKQINLIIQRAARLRVGNFASNLINASKVAIKTQNVEALIKIIRIGDL